MPGLVSTSTEISVADTPAGPTGDPEHVGLHDDRGMARGGPGSRSSFSAIPRPGRSPAQSRKGKDIGTGWAVVKKSHLLPTTPASPGFGPQGARCRTTSTPLFAQLASLNRRCPLGLSARSTLPTTWPPRRWGRSAAMSWSWSRSRAHWAGPTTSSGCGGTCWPTGSSFWISVSRLSSRGALQQTSGLFSETRTSKR